VVERDGCADAQRYAGGTGNPQPIAPLREDPDGKLSRIEARLVRVGGYKPNIIAFAAANADTRAFRVETAERFSAERTPELEQVRGVHAFISPANAKDQRPAAGGSAASQR
jgi:hypothetical protein